MPCLAHAQDTFDGQRLTIPKVLVNNDVYSNVVITISEVVSVAGGNPTGNYDTYKVSTNELRIPSVVYGGSTFNNVVVKVGQVLAVGGVAGPPSETASMTSGIKPWFHNYLRNDDGSETLVLTTMGLNSFNKFTDPTPIMLLKPNGNGVADVTSQLFDIAPSLYWGRNVVAFKDPLTSQQALWFCNQGREVGDYQLASTPRVNGIWGEQDKLFIMKNGKFVDQSSQLPQVVDFSHGCSAANIGDGNSLVLVKNTLGSFGGNPSMQMLANNGISYLKTAFNSNILNTKTLSTYWTGVGDFSKRGAADVLFSQQLVRLENGIYKVSQTLRAPDLEAQGYTLAHSGTIGDINGDGFLDVILVFSGDGVKQAFLSGAMLAVFLNDGKGNLVYAPEAIPNRLPAEMGLDIKLFDVNFDGKKDIVTTGAKYDLGNSSKDYSARTLYLNNGNGTFSKRNIVDAEMDRNCLAYKNSYLNGCQMTYYFLSNNDISSYSIIMTGIDSSQRSYAYARKVTAENPIGLQ